jgi:hypothetical protein
VIGEKVLGAFALAALACHRVSALVWFDIAPTLGLMRYVPSLAVAEVRAVRPDAVPLLADLLTHPSVIVGDSTPPRPVRLINCSSMRTSSTLARLMWRTSREGWPALIADPGRLRRVDPDVQLDLL